METSSETFVDMCDYYGIPQFKMSDTYESHELRSLATIKEIIMFGNPLTNSHLSTLKNLLGRDSNE